MTQLYNTSEQATLFSSNRYPSSNAETEFMGLTGKRNTEMRSMTIAAFRVAQNNTEIDAQLMNKELLYFLLAGSDSAINHWKTKGRLEEGEQGYNLTEDGIQECSKSLNGFTRGYNTSEEKVQEWTARMLHGDVVTSRRLEL